MTRFGHRLSSIASSDPGGQIMFNNIIYFQLFESYQQAYKAQIDYILAARWKFQLSHQSLL